MSAPHQPRLDPEILGVLQDIAKQPDSALLRVRRRDLSLDSIRRIEPVRPSAWWLTSAERHLVEAHREDVAYLLRSLLIRLLHGKSAKEENRLIVQDFGGELKFFMLDHQSLSARISGGLRFSCGAFLHGEEDDIAHALSAGSSLSGKTNSLNNIVCVAIAALRLSAHTSVHCNLGHAYLEVGQFGAAERYYAIAAGNGSTTAVRRAATEGLGAAAAMRGNWSQAFYHYRMACEFQDSNYVAKGFELLNALQIGDTAAAVSAHREVSIEAQRSPEYEASLRGILRTASLEWGWRPTREAVAIVRSSDTLRESWCAAQVVAGGV